MSERFPASGLKKNTKEIAWRDKREGFFLIKIITKVVAFEV